MGKPNDRNYQLRLMFQDGDLKKPEHDAIMLWLEKQVRSPKFMEQFVPQNHATFTSSSVNKVITLDGEPHNGAAYQNQAYLERRLNSAFPVSQNTQHKIEDAINPPRPTIEFVKSTWEPILYDVGPYDRQQRVGFLDLLVEYLISEQLTWNIHAQYAATRDIETDFDFEHVATKEFWSHTRMPTHVGFEVKSEIRSIGELMRQLQLYKSTHTYARNRMTITVVAPPHADAKEVLNAQGFGFIEYDPTLPIDD